VNLRQYMICETLLRRELLLLRRRRREEEILNRRKRKSYNRFLRTSLKRLEWVRRKVEVSECPFCGRRFKKRHGLIVHLTSGRSNRCSFTLSMVIKYEVSRYFSTCEGATE
jgi:hypothetical protein